jgi:hypothetical protein
MQNYLVADQQPTFLLLAISNHPAIRRRTISTIRARLGDLVDVPASTEPLYAGVTIRDAPAGQLATLLFQPPQLHISMRYGGGMESSRYRLVQRTAADGLFVSTFVAGIEDMSRAMSRHFDKPILALRVTADSPAGLYQPDVEVTFFTESGG